MMNYNYQFYPLVSQDYNKISIMQNFHLAKGRPTIS
jgi:hypothetical protein